VVKDSATAVGEGGGRIGEGEGGHAVGFGDWKLVSLGELAEIDRERGR